MDELKALDVYRQFIDQATGLGLFKSADQVIIMTESYRVLAKAVQDKKPAGPGQLVEN
jgi:hypothetical protein